MPCTATEPTRPRSPTVSSRGWLTVPQGKLILVTAMTPTPAGEGKTTTSVGLADALNRIGKKTAVCLREPSLGPCFGVKGGAAGGGRAQVVPMEDINLHFTGDFHAISSANNLLAALIDNHVYWSNGLNLDPRRISWRRVMDMNDRALRSIVCSLGGVPNGFPREDGFDITPASEVMAILCLSENIADLHRRLGNIIVGHTRDRRPVRASELKADGPMAVLLRDAFMPNLVQTLEGNPAIIHGGPFANIAHGCNSVVATKTALRLADYVVTEAGFGADLGAEKFFDIKCRKAGLEPDATVVVATIRALKMHGGVAKEDLGKPNPDALVKGLENLSRHVENLRNFGVPQMVAVNRFTSDTDEEIDIVRQHCAELDVAVAIASHWSDGGAGAEDLAHEVVSLIGSRAQPVPAHLSRQHAPVGQGPHRCPDGLWRPRNHRRQEGPRSVQGVRGRGIWRFSGLHCQNAVQFLHRSQSAWRSEQSRRADPRNPAGRRCRIPGRAVRRNHDHARSSAGSGGQSHVPGRGGPDRRPFLKIRWHATCLKYGCRLDPAAMVTGTRTNGP